MLYERWRHISGVYGSERGLHDLGSGRRWTFRELARAGERFPAGPSRLVFPRGVTAEFILVLLAGWREGRVVSPLEENQTPLMFDQLPPECVHLKRTSASTGDARVIAFTAAQLAADVENIMATMGLRPDWPNVGAISLAHSYGFSNLVLPLVLHGVPLILAGGPYPEAMRRAAELSAGLTIAAVPALWRAWLEADAIPKQTRLAISAGAPLPLELERAIYDRFGLKIHNFYGASECGGIAYDRSDRPRDDAALVGEPMATVEVSLHEAGCLCVRSRAVGATYWPEPEAALGHGRFQTNDLAELQGGKVFLRGRLSDLINSAGKKVAPESIERALRTHAAVRDCLVLGLPDCAADRSEIPAAVVVLGSVIDADELKQHLLERLPAWQIPKEWWFVESLSPNERGKISRAEWRKRFLAQLRRQPADGDV